MEIEASSIIPDVATPAADQKEEQPQHAASTHDPDTCVICLCDISERAVAVPCNHLVFDFLCLVSWLQERSTCPLCKTPVTSVQYDWRAPDDYKTFRVYDESARASSAPATPSSSGQTRFSRYGLSQRGRARGRGCGRGDRFLAYGERAHSSSSNLSQALERRKRVYTLHAFSQHVGANRVSQFRDFTPSTFAASSELQARARAFMRRELQVFEFLDLQSRREFLIEYVVGILKKLEIKGASGAAERLVGEFLGVESARLFLHELEAWLRSPYTKLEDWDRMVQYADPGLMNRKAGGSSTPRRGT